MTIFPLTPPARTGTISVHGSTAATVGPDRRPPALGGGMSWARRRLQTPLARGPDCMGVGTVFSLPLVRAEANCASADAPLAGDNCCRRRNLLVRGNRKLGPDLLAFSLVAGLPSAGGTCPGASDACLADCYARGGNFCWT